MKRIGYIHRYSSTEKKGILVYGYNMEPSWNSPSPILFSRDQCKTSIKTGSLVFFNIDEENIVSNIQQASIFNFDKVFMEELVSVFDSKDWKVAKKHTQIRYQNIYELEEFYEFENSSVKRDGLGNSSDVEISEGGLEESSIDLIIASRRSSVEILEDELESDFFDLGEELLDDEDYTSIGEYRKVTIPTSIEGEYALFGKQFRSYPYNGLYCDYIEENHFIYVDLLNPNLWIYPISKSRRNYYGKNVEEFIELFKILVLKERHSKERSRLFINNCVSANWRYLLDRLSDEELKAVYKSCVLLQPILPKNFCEHNIEILSEKYGFPSVEIADLFLTCKIRNIKTATDFCHFRERIRVYKQCGVKHLSDEGIPLCALSKERLNTLSKRIGRKFIYVRRYVFAKISQVNPNVDFGNLIDWEDAELVLKVGCFLDVVDKLISSFNPGLISFREEEMVSAYNGLPNEISPLFDSYISRVLKDKLKMLLERVEISPYSFHLLIEDFSKWIDNSFIVSITPLACEKFSKNINIQDLKDAYKYHYIPESLFVDKYLTLTEQYTSHQLLAELIDHSGYTFPDKIQLHILKSKLQDMDLSEVVPSYRNLEHICYDYHEIRSVYDFLQWINTESMGMFPNISKTVYYQIQDEVISKLSIDDKWYLFEKELIYTPGENKVKEILSEVYSKQSFKSPYLIRDCFQSQMAYDVISFSDFELIKKVIEILKQDYRDKIANDIEGFGKVYIWALNPNADVDLDELRRFFLEFPDNIKKRVFLYLFKLRAENRVNIDLLDFFGDIIESQILQNIVESQRSELYSCLMEWEVWKNGNMSSAIYALILILKSKLANPTQPLNYGQLKPALTMFTGGMGAMLKALKGFFIDCGGWRLLSYESPDKKYFTWNGYVNLFTGSEYNGYKYRVCFYETPLDLKGRQTNYVNTTYLKRAEAVLKKNFNYIYDNGTYLVHAKDEIKLKQYVMLYDIDDKCNLFDESVDYGRNPLFGFPFLALPPKYTNYETIYKKNENFICNCGLFMDLDPIYGIPFRWCKNKPCTRSFFLQPDSEWEKYKFADLLWILAKDKITKEQLWEINYEISHFFNEIIDVIPDQNISIESKLPKEADEVGKWTEGMSIFSSDSWGQYEYDEDLENSDYDEEDI